MAALVARPVSSLLVGAAVPWWYFLVSFSSFTLGYITNVPSAHIQAKEASGTLVVADTLTLIAILGLNIYFIAFAKLGLLGILLSPLIAGSVKASILAVWTVREAGFRIDWSSLQGMLAFGAPLVFSNLAMFTLNFSDRFFLKHFETLDTVGVYAVGYRFGFLLNIALIQPFCTMWQARMYVIDRRPDKDAIFRRIFIFYSFLLIFCGLGLSLASPEVIRVMVDPKFAASQRVIPVVTLAYVVYGVAAFVQAGLMLSARTQAIGKFSSIAAVLNLCLNYVFVSQFGVMGAAWATVLGFLTIAAGSCYLSWRDFARKLDVDRVVKALLAAMALYAISASVTVGSPTMSVLFKTALLAAFPVVLVAGRILSSDEIATLSSARYGAYAFGARMLRLAPINGNHMIHRFQQLLHERADEWNIPRDGVWRFLFHNNFHPHCSTFNVLWFHGSDRFPRVVTKVCRKEQVLAREFESLQSMSRLLPAHIPQPLGLDSVDGFSALWMAGVPGVRVPPQTGLFAFDSEAVVDIVIAMNEAVRKEAGAGTSDRHLRMVTEPLDVLSQFGGSAAVRDGCQAMAAAVSAGWLNQLPVVPQHGDLFLDNILHHADQWHVVDWETFGMIDFPGFDLFTLLLSALRVSGETPDKWNPKVVRQMPLFVKRYARDLGIPASSVPLLLPLALTKWFHMQWLEGRKAVMERMYSNIQHYFENEKLWQEVFLTARS